MTDALEQSLDLLRTGRLSAAMQVLSQIWARTRDETVGNTLVELQAFVCPEPFEGNHRAWMKRASLGHPADTAVLMEALHEGEPGKARARERVQVLLARTPDPSTYRVMLERVWRLPHPDRGADYEKLLTHHADPAVPIWEGFAQDSYSAGFVAAWRKRLTRVESHAAGLTVSVEGVQALAQALSTGFQGDLSQLMDLLPPAADPVLTELWNAVNAEPAEDTHRWVFADRAAQQDPGWAELVQLQLEREVRPLTPAEQKALRALEKRQLQFLGPLAQAVDGRGLRFRRGFVDTATVVSRDPEQARASGDLSGWSTATSLYARHVSFYEGSGVDQLLGAGTLFVRDLAEGRWVPNPGGKGLDGAQIRKLSAGGPWPWRVLQLKHTHSDDETFRTCLPDLDLPALETLVLVSSYLPADTVPLLPAAREVLVTPCQLDLQTLLRAMPDLQRFVISGAAELERSEDTWSVRFRTPTTAEKRRMEGAWDDERRQAFIEELRAHAEVRVIEDTQA